jgi:hypothetical protein
MSDAETTPRHVTRTDTDVTPSEWRDHADADQRDARWIVIRRSLWGHNDMQGVIGVFSYY